MTIYTLVSRLPEMKAPPARPPDPIRPLSTIVRGPRAVALPLLVSLGLVLNGCGHRTIYPYERTYGGYLRDSDDPNILYGDSDLSEERRAEKRQERLAAANEAAASFASSVREEAADVAAAVALLERHGFDCSGAERPSCRNDRDYYAPSVSPLGSFGFDPSHCLSWIAKVQPSSEGPPDVEVTAHHLDCR
ncbi:MAG: hypothetical protein Kilf2KO_07730 [Rhodospirillales bacterium]